MRVPHLFLFFFTSSAPRVLCSCPAEGMPSVTIPEPSGLLWHTSEHVLLRLTSARHIVLLDVTEQRENFLRRGRTALTLNDVERLLTG